MNFAHINLWLYILLFISITDTYNLEEMYIELNS